LPQGCHSAEWHPYLTSIPYSTDNFECTTNIPHKRLLEQMTSGEFSLTENFGLIPEQCQGTATDTKTMGSTLDNGQQPAGGIPEQSVDDDYTVSTYPQRLSPWYNDFVPSTTGESHPNSTMTIKTSMLCSKCSQIRAWLAKHWAKLKIVNQTFEHIFNHYDDSRHLKQSAHSGCHLCTLFLNNFDRKMVHSQA
jgi:hypothetical protein